MNPKNKSIQNIENKITTPNKTETADTEKMNLEYSMFPKPELSPITEHIMTIQLKQHGSYKKPKTRIPESPMKSPLQKFFTPVKIQGKNLFGTETKTNEINGCKPRRLSFNEINDNNMNKVANNNFMELLNKVDEKDEDKEMDKYELKFLGEKKTKDKIKQMNFGAFKLNLNPNKKSKADNYIFAQNSMFNKTPFVSSLFRNDKQKKYNIHYQRMDKEYKILKTLSESKYDQVLKCENILTKQIEVIKKIYKTSFKNDVKTLQMLYNDINSVSMNINKKFCMPIKDYWVEEEIIELDDCLSKYTDKYLYILYDYCPNGDLLDYLSKLEQNHFNFTHDFYWDIIFEMLIGVLFIHQLGYLHLDIKPANFLVDKDGYIKLSDFGLSKKLSCLNNIEDVFDGDSTYISNELFKRKKLSDLNTKCDVYSLGLSFLEILAKVDLPKNGELWRQMREYQIQSFPQEFLINWNITNIDTFVLLIQNMIAPPYQRLEIYQILNNQSFPQLYIRYQAHLNGCYKKSICCGNVNNESIFINNV